VFEEKLYANMLRKLRHKQYLNGDDIACLVAIANKVLNQPEILIIESLLVCFVFFPLSLCLFHSHSVVS
jgi:hypothetical protein